MSRVVINPDQLAETASVLESAAGEYEAVGARVAACDCGCMPADVAAVVDSMIASTRGGLETLASDVAAEAGELAWRSGVPQDGGTPLVIGGEATATAAASGGVELVITGDTYAPALSAGGGLGLLITNDAYPVAPVGGGLTIGGSPSTGGVELLIVPDRSSDWLSRIPGPANDPFWNYTVTPMGVVGTYGATSEGLNAGNIAGVTIGGGLTALGNAGGAFTASGPGYHQFNRAEGSNFFHRPGELAGTVR